MDARRLPDGFPWGWFLVAKSADVPRGGIETIRIFGRSVVVFRGQDGKVGVLDAHCPHLGAHLGDGRVIGNHIQCPFHKWQFAPDGPCAAIPYASRVPRARARAYPVREWNGLILAYHHPAGAPPAFEPPALEESMTRGWSPWLRKSIEVRAPIYDIAENPADAAHFFAVHRFVEPPVVDYVFDGPVSRFEQEQRFRFFGVPVSVRARATSFGPGLSVVHIEQLVDMVLVLNPVPVERDLTRLHFSVSVRKRHGVERAAARFASWQVHREFRVDQRIWERKAYLTHPILCDGDGPILAFRKWYRQFYDLAAPAPRSAEHGADLV